MNLEVKDFNFELPEELIAQGPLEDPSASRLMGLARETGEVEDRNFEEFPV